MNRISTDPAIRIDIDARPDRVFTKTFNINNSDGTPFDFTGYTGKMLLRKFQGDEPILTLEDGSGFTLSEGVISFLKSDEDFTLTRHKYLYEIILDGGAGDVTWINGIVDVNDKVKDSTQETETLTISLSGEEVTITIDTGETEASVESKYNSAVPEITAAEKNARTGTDVRRFSPKDVAYMSDVGMINAKWYGAVGDGVTDDTAAIQAAIDAVQYHGTVVIPDGEYKTTSTLTVTNPGVKIIGVSPHLTGGGQKGTKILYSGSGFAVEFFNTWFNSLLNIGIEGADYPTITAGRNGVIIHSDNGTSTTKFITIENVQMWNFDVGLQVGNTSAGDGSGTQYQSDFNRIKTCRTVNCNTCVRLLSQNNDSTEFDNLFLAGVNRGISIESAGYVNFKDVSINLSSDTAIGVYAVTGLINRMTFDGYNNEAALATNQKAVVLESTSNPSPITFRRYAAATPFVIGTAATSYTAPLKIDNSIIDNLIVESNSCKLQIDTCHIKTGSIVEVNGNSSKIVHSNCNIEAGFAPTVTGTNSFFSSTVISNDGAVDLTTITTDNLGVGTYNDSIGGFQSEGAWNNWVSDLGRWAMYFRDALSAIKAYFEYDGSIFKWVTSGAGTKIQIRPNNLLTCTITEDRVQVKKLAVENSAAATTPGTVTNKIEVFDSAGTSLGFVAVYDSIT